MKKLFLIPLMALVCSVMAFATVRTAGTFEELQSALSAAVDGDEIQLTSDIVYPTNGTGLVNINKSITLDGKGHTLYGYGTATIKTDGTEPFPTALAVNASVFDKENAPTLNVAIKNLTLGNIKNEYWPNGTQKTMVDSPSRFYGLSVYDGVASLTMDNVNILVGRKDNNNNKNSQPSNSHQMMCITGINSTPLDLTITNSRIYAGEGKYPVYILKPINATLENSTFEGYCALYFKYRANPTPYGEVVGSRGSVVNSDACAFNAPNVYSGNTNAFALFPMEDDGITLNLNNCSFNAQQIGDQAQMVISMQGVTRTSGFQPVRVNISGDNTHVYNVDLLTFALTGWNWDDDNHLTTYKPAADAPLQLNISGGTFSINPEKIKFHTYKDNGASFDIDSARIATGYEVQEVKQGSATLYRVVKKPATYVDPETSEVTLYDLNDAVETAAKGQNPVTSFELSTGGAPMVLNQDTTKAGYVQVKDNATEGATTVKVGKVVAETKVDQTLIINNGLDVQGNSKVEVQAGSALVIGEGGITTEDPENIIIEADEKGAASLLLDPTITVNQTPELTVKMTVPAEHAGYEMLGSDKYRHWFRFAMPVKSMAATWTKEPDVPTYLYGWDYANQKWAQVGVTSMQPFYGYTLSPNQEITGSNSAVTYTFKGKLLGNEDCKLELNHHGYNFFGNSYTGYISILKLVEQIMGDAKIDGTVWMWDGEKYEGVALANLAARPALYPDWQKEVAPMQTFVLRLTGEDFASTDINYADAIWGNPRYNKAVSALSAAPARNVEMNDNAIIRMTISANNQSESVLLIENNDFSDEYNRGYDAIKFMNENSFNSYVSVNGENYGTVATDNLEGKTLSLRTNDAYTYTITFDFVAGEEYALRDNATNKVIAIEQGATYEFAVQPNSTIEDRFVIMPIVNAPTAIENTEETAKANVKGIYTIMGQYLGEDFQALPAGVYVVDGVKIVK